VKTTITKLREIVDDVRRMSLRTLELKHALRAFGQHREVCAFKNGRSRCDCGLDYAMNPPTEDALKRSIRSVVKDLGEAK
jgi:signal transduction histidine kinase